MLTAVRRSTFLQLLTLWEAVLPPERLLVSHDVIAGGVISCSATSRRRVGLWFSLWRSWLVSWGSWDSPVGGRGPFKDAAPFLLFPHLLLDFSVSQSRLGWNWLVLSFGYAIVVLPFYVPGPGILIEIWGWVVTRKIQNVHTWFYFCVSWDKFSSSYIAFFWNSFFKSFFSLLFVCTFAK